MEHAVVPVPNAEFLFIWLKMDIRGALLDGIEQNLVDEANHRGIIGIRAQVNRALGPFARRQIDAVQIDAEKVLEGCIRGIDRRINGLDELLLLDHHDLDGHAGVELDFLEGCVLAGIGDGQKQTMAAFEQRQHMMSKYQFFADRHDRQIGGEKHRKVEQRHRKFFCHGGSNLKTLQRASVDEITDQRNVFAGRFIGALQRPVFGQQRPIDETFGQTTESRQPG